MKETNLFFKCFGKLRNQLWFMSLMVILLTMITNFFWTIQTPMFQTMIHVFMFGTLCYVFGSILNGYSFMSPVSTTLMNDFPAGGTKTSFTLIFAPMFSYLMFTSIANRYFFRGTFYWKKMVKQSLIFETRLPTERFHEFDDVFIWLEIDHVICGDTGIITSWTRHGTFIVYSKLSNTL